MSAVLAQSRLERVMAMAHTDIEIVDWSDEYLIQAADIAQEMHVNSIYRDLPLDEAKVLSQLIAAGNGVVPDRYFRIAVLHGEALGGFYGHVRRTFFCDEILAHDLGWWVKKSARNTMAAPMLLLDFERWAREKGARKIMVGQSTEQDIEKTTRLFANCGFRVFGFNTVKYL